jgi:general stress protein YciG
VKKMADNKKRQNTMTDDNALSGSGVSSIIMSSLGDMDASEEASTMRGQQGFASMSKEKQREIASKGGKAAHKQGTAHEWTSKEAAEAGRRGGQNRTASSIKPSNE